MKIRRAFLFTFAFLDTKAREAKFKLLTAVSTNLAVQETVVIVSADIPSIKDLYKAVLECYQQIDDEERREWFGRWLDVLRGDSNKANRFAVPDKLGEHGDICMTMKTINVQNGTFVLKMDFTVVAEGASS
jgi:hypothetical protein